MKLLPVSLYLLVALCLLGSCKKNNNGTTPTPPPVTGSMHINLSPGTPSNFELIISEPGGKILLDTMSPFQGNIVATLKTNQTLVDITTVSYIAQFKYYSVASYKSVNPSAWTNLFPGSIFAYAALPQEPGMHASILFTNAPSQYSYASSSGYVDESSVSSATQVAPNEIQIGYNQYSSANYVYTLFPLSGLYNFHLPKGLVDTVDLTHTDTTQIVTFNLPSNDTVISNDLYGYLDSTDLTKSVTLYHYFLPIPGMPLLQYPRKMVQKLELLTEVDGPNHESYVYYSFGNNTIPSNFTPPFYDGSAYSMSSTKNNSFSVHFPSVHPSYYQTGWTNGTVNLSIMANPDSTTIDPLDFLTSLNSKLLKGQTLNTLSLYDFTFETLQGLDYPGYFSYVYDPAGRTKPIASAILFEKTF